MLTTRCAVSVVVLDLAHGPQSGTCPWTFQPVLSGRFSEEKPMPDPTNVDDIKRDPKLMDAYVAYARRRAMLNEVQFYFDTDPPQKIYRDYMDPKSPEAVNIESPKITGEADKLAKSQDWRNGAWPKLIKAAKEMVAEALNPDVANGFCQSPEFKNFRKKKMGNPAKAAKLLGISDVPKLKLAMEAQVTGDQPRAKKLFGELLKQEKSKERAESIIKALQNSGFF
jgi:hypothetical protein